MPVPDRLVHEVLEVDQHVVAVLRRADIRAEEQLVLALVQEPVAELRVAADGVEAAARGDVTVDVRVVHDELDGLPALDHRALRVAAAGLLGHIAADLRPERLGVAEEDEVREVGDRLLEPREVQVVNDAVGAADLRGDMEGHGKLRLLRVVEEVAHMRVVEAEVEGQLADALAARLLEPRHEVAEIGLGRVPHLQWVDVAERDEAWPALADLQHILHRLDVMRALGVGAGEDHRAVDPDFIVHLEKLLGCCVGLIGPWAVGPGLVPRVNVDVNDHGWSLHAIVSAGRLVSVAVRRREEGTCFDAA